MAAVNPGGLILAVNSGSSSLKFGLYRLERGDEQSILSGAASGIGQPGSRLQISDGAGRRLVDREHPLPAQPEALAEAVQALASLAPTRPSIVGHRVVHGGPHLRNHQPITPRLIQALQNAVHFAPLHIPASLALIEATERLLPEAAQFACFDTAFHASMPETNARFALPDELYRKGIQRYGFHGLSCESVLHRLGPAPPPRLIIAHLGSGSSITAVLDGRSLDTSMGLTPLGGFPMATRSGDLDPGVLLFLMRNEAMDADTLEALLNHNSGLIALNNGVADMREIEAAANRGEAPAKLALAVFTQSVRKFIGAYAAEMGGLDRLIFTGGIGENSQTVRRLACAGLEFLGLDPAAPDAAGKVTVMPSEEEAQIARLCRRMQQAEIPSPS
jgi:acetate kinase